MGEPGRHLRAVGEANEEVRGIAEQALAWVRVSEERVAAAERRSELFREELRERAMETLRTVSAEARERIAAERKARREAEAKVPVAEQARDRAEQAFE